MKKYRVVIMLANGRFIDHIAMLAVGNLTEQLSYVEDNIDSTGTFYTAKKDNLIPLMNIANIMFEEIK